MNQLGPINHVELEMLAQASFKIEMMYELDIQKMLLNNIEPLQERLIVIQNEYTKFDNTKMKPDIIALDEEANIVIIELKRENTIKGCYMQAVHYASFSAKVTKNDIIEMYAEFLASRYKNKLMHSLYEKKIFEYMEERYIDKEVYDIEDFKEMAKWSLSNYFNSKLSEIEFNKKQRIILVARQFNFDNLSAIKWMIERGIDYKCVELNLYFDHRTNIYYLYSNVLLPDLDIQKHEQNGVIFKKTQEELYRWENPYEAIKIIIYRYYISHLGRTFFYNNINENILLIPTCLPYFGIYYELKWKRDLTDDYTENIGIIEISLKLEDSKEINQKVFEHIKRMIPNLDDEKESRISYEIHNDRAEIIFKLLYEDKVIVKLTDSTESEAFKIIDAANKLIKKFNLLFEPLINPSNLFCYEKISPNEEIYEREEIL